MAAGDRNCAAQERAFATLSRTSPPLKLGESDFFNQSSTRCMSGGEALFGANPLLTSSGIAISLYLSRILFLLLSSDRRSNAFFQSLIVTLWSEAAGASSGGIDEFGDDRSSVKFFELKSLPAAGE